MEYMDKHYPVVQFGESKVRIAYSLGRGEEDNGWTCDKVPFNIVLSFLFVILRTCLNQ